MAGRRFAVLLSVDAAPAEESVDESGPEVASIEVVEPGAAGRSRRPATVRSTSREVRRDFPILSETVNGRPLVWFDNAATTQKPRAVIDRISYFYEHENSNIHRAAHELAARATDAYEDARDTVAKFIGAPAARTSSSRHDRGHQPRRAVVGRQAPGGDEIVITISSTTRISSRSWSASRPITPSSPAPVDDRNLLLDELERLVGPRTKRSSRAPRCPTRWARGRQSGSSKSGTALRCHASSSTARSRSSHADRRRRPRRRLLRVLRTQDRRPDGDRRPLGTEDALADTPPWQAGAT